MKHVNRLMPTVFVFVLLLAIGSTGCRGSAGTRISTATKNGITISAGAGFGGFAKQNEWLPINVVLENSGEPVGGRVIVKPFLVNTPASIYQQKIDLGHRSKKHLLFNVRFNRFGNTPAEISLISDGEVLAKTVTRYTEVEPGAQIILALTDEDANRQFFKDLAADSPDIKISYIGPKDLPYRDNSLDQVSSIIISGTSTRVLAKEQKSALLNWIASGGKLVIGGGPGWEKTVSGIPEELLPVKPSGTRLVDSLVPIEGFARKIVEDGHHQPYQLPLPVLAATAPEFHGRVLAGDKSNPLIVSKSFGFGEIAWIAADLTLEPFTSWRLNPLLWKRLNGVEPDDPEAKGKHFFSQFDDISGAISSIPALKTPSVAWLIPFILLYIIAIGPINYFLLRRRDKKEFAWFTIPIIILVFTVGSFAYAYTKKGGSLLINQINVVKYLPDVGIAKVYNSFGVFSPAKEKYSLKMPPDSSISELSTPGPVMPGNASSALMIEDGLNPHISEMNIGMWSMRGAYTERYAKMKPALEGSIEFNDSGATVNLNNKSKDTLSSAILITNKYIWHVGTLPASKERRIKLGIGGRVENNSINGPLGHQIYEPWNETANSREDSREKLIMAETFNIFFGNWDANDQKSPVVMAWLKKPLERVNITGEKPLISGRTALIFPLKTVIGKSGGSPESAIKSDEAVTVLKN